MVVITHFVNKRPIVEQVLVRFYMRRKGTIEEVSFPGRQPEKRIVKEDYIDKDYEKVERYPPKSSLFKVVKTSGTSAVKTYKYFKHLGDLINYLEELVAQVNDDYHNYIPYKECQELGLVLTELKNDKHKKIIFNRRNITWKVS